MIVKCDKWLTKWCLEYNIGRESIHWMGFVDLTDKTLSTICADNVIGLTKGYNVSDNPYTEVFLSEKLLKKKIFRNWRIKSVLWHEFCHAFVMLNGGWYSGHGEKWKKVWKKKVWLTVLEVKYW